MNWPRHGASILWAAAQSAHQVIRGESPLPQDRADTANAEWVGLGPDDGTLVPLPSGPPFALHADPGL